MLVSCLDRFRCTHLGRGAFRSPGTGFTWFPRSVDAVSRSLIWRPVRPQLTMSSTPPPAPTPVNAGRPSCCSVHLVPLRLIHRMTRSHGVVGVHEKRHTPSAGGSYGRPNPGVCTVRLVGGARARPRPRTFRPTRRCRRAARSAASYVLVGALDPRARGALHPSVTRTGRATAVRQPALRGNGTDRLFRAYGSERPFGRAISAMLHMARSLPARCRREWRERAGHADMFSCRRGECAVTELTDRLEHEARRAALAHVLRAVVRPASSSRPS